jgi:hypothetical protein
MFRFDDWKMNEATCSLYERIKVAANLAASDKQDTNVEAEKLINEEYKIWKKRVVHEHHSH